MGVQHPCGYWENPQCLQLGAQETLHGQDRGLRCWQWPTRRDKLADDQSPRVKVCPCLLCEAQVPVGSVSDVAPSALGLGGNLANRPAASQRATDWMGLLTVPALFPSMGQKIHWASHCRMASSRVVGVLHGDGLRELAEHPLLEGLSLS